MELGEFRNVRTNINQNIRAIIRGIRFVSQKTLNGKVCQVARVTHVKTRKSGNREKAAPKVERNAKHVSMTTEAPGKTVTAAYQGKMSGSLKVEAWRKLAHRKRKDQRKIKSEVIFISKREKGSYADILRRVLADLELTNLEANISRM